MNDLAAWLGTVVQRGGRGRKKDRERDGGRETERGMSKVKADTEEGMGLRPRVFLVLAIPFFHLLLFPYLVLSVVKRGVDVEVDGVGQVECDGQGEDG
jgi:hypothetical protein